MKGTIIKIPEKKILGTSIESGVLVRSHAKEQTIKEMFSLYLRYAALPYFFARTKKYQEMRPANITTICRDQLSPALVQSDLSNSAFIIVHLRQS
jgi:hypothetical protein